jgi:hypothetical protein
VVSDQVSVTAYRPEHKLLGMGCANGLTALVSTSNLSMQGSQKGHKSGVNACFISKKKYLISGTSDCTYHVQPPEGSMSFPMSFILTILLTGLFVFLMGSNVLDNGEL